MAISSATSSLQQHEESLVRWLLWNLRHSSAVSKGLRVDSGGWVELQIVVKALPVSFTGWTVPTVAEFSQWVLSLPGERFEVRHGRIRALYGHSLCGLEVASVSTPPAKLYHGTNGCLLSEILSRGLLPMGRNRVHLTADLDYAHHIAWKFAHPAVILIDTVTALQAGVQFFASGMHVWQVARIAPEFLSILGIPTDSTSTASDAGEI